MNDFVAFSAMQRTATHCNALKKPKFEKTLASEL